MPTYEYKYIDQNKNITWFSVYKDLDTAIAAAKISKRNILIIFTGYATMDDSRKHWKTLSLSKEKLNDYFEILLLYIDDKRKLSDTTKTQTWNNIEVPIKTIGDKNFHFQINLTKTATEPTFCFIDTNINLTGQIIGYTNDQNVIDKFADSGKLK